MSTTRNIVVGSGRIYFNPQENGSFTGLRYLAETPGFSLGAQSDTVQVDSSDGPIAERLVDVPIRVTRSGRLGLRNVIEDNIAMFFIGAVSDVSQASTPVVDEAHVVRPGRLYQLGASITNPGGVRNVSSVVVTTEDGLTTYVAGTDYTVNAELGMIEILEGGAITADQIVHVDYTPAAETRKRVATHQLGPARGELRFVADNTTGAPKDILIPMCMLAPDGESEFKSRDNPVEMAFQLLVQSRPGYAQIYVDGRAA
jgi:hypothetical protein